MIVMHHAKPNKLQCQALLIADKVSRTEWLGVEEGVDKKVENVEICGCQLSKIASGWPAIVVIYSSRNIVDTFGQW